MNFMKEASNIFFFVEFCHRYSEISIDCGKISSESCFGICLLPPLFHTEVFRACVISSFFFTPQLELQAHRLHELYMTYGRIGLWETDLVGGCCVAVWCLWFVDCLTSQQHGSVFWVCIMCKQLYVLPHRDRSCRSNLLSRPVTANRHRANQSKH